jgi:hypothetical protein
MDGFNQIQSEFIGVRCSDLPTAAFHVVKLWPFWTRAHLSSLQATNLCQKIQIYWNLKNDVASCDIMNGLFCFPAFSCLEWLMLMDLHAFHWTAPTIGSEVPRCMECLVQTYACNHHATIEDNGICFRIVLWLDFSNASAEALECTHCLAGW